jgi:hypothetical protein
MRNPFVENYKIYRHLITCNLILLFFELKLVNRFFLLLLLLPAFSKYIVEGNKLGILTMKEVIINIIQHQKIIKIIYILHF